MPVPVVVDDSWVLNSSELVRIVPGIDQRGAGGPTELSGERRICGNYRGGFLARRRYALLIRI